MIIIDNKDSIYIKNSNYTISKDIGENIFKKVGMMETFQQDYLKEIKSSVSKIKKVIDEGYDSSKIKNELNAVSNSVRRLSINNTLPPEYIVFFEYMSTQVKHNTHLELENLVKKTYCNVYNNKFNIYLNNFINNSKDLNLICCGTLSKGNTECVWCIFDTKLIYINPTKEKIYSYNIKFGKYNIIVKKL